MNDKVRYFCVLDRPAMIADIPYLLEEGERQGWEAVSVLFCGFTQVSKLDIAQKAITPIYTVIFAKHGNKGIRPLLPHFGPAAGPVAPAVAPADVPAPGKPIVVNTVPFKKPEAPEDGPGDLNDGRR